MTRTDTGVDWAARVRWMRGVTGETIAQFAARQYTTRQTISRWEHGVSVPMGPARELLGREFARLAAREDAAGAVNIPR